ncbi:heterokaryon incompatibility protein-domain-containing protein [Apodospora peruviana]|uniref:Heterokaryon incompatibility protein-domain-containing protein n=1 Tax=Apodospora peruviana TaxID=516989 RepID=A0AAE0HX79_9PEZI|nr:heterokaryon incompatibility protein-domain-containing protein [Apodospora peruviana]
MTAAYKYAPLGDLTSGIRLLSVTSIVNGNISISLREVTSLQSEPYNCLSYTWGPKSPEFEVLCDGSPLKIRQNLHDALFHLHKLVPDKLSAIWIDAVCIDQGNDAEKPPQLARMHDIYAGAESVLIWLGTLGAATAVRLFEDVVRRIERSFPDVEGEAFWDRMLELNDGNSADKALSDLPLICGIDAERWLAVHGLAHREYFRRQWIWQEVIASRADPLVFCGHNEISWEGLRKASHALTVFGDTRLIKEGRMPNPEYADGRQGMAMRTANLPYQLAWYRGQYRRYGQPWMRARFGKLVLQGNRNAYTCSVEHDRLYAMIGICGFDRLAGWGYDRPFEELYQYFWFDALSRTKEVNFLTFVEDVSARSNRSRMAKDDAEGPGRFYDAKLPSWVPDLRASLEPDSLWACFEHRDDFNISRGLPGRRSRSEGEPVHGMRVDEAKKRLKLDGYLFDTIQSGAQSASEMLEMTKQILSDPDSEEDSHQGALDALWKSMALLTSPEVDQAFPVTDSMALTARRWLLRQLRGGEEASLESLRSEVRRLDRNNLVFPSESSRQSFPRLGIHDDAAVSWGMKGMKLFRTRDHWVGKGTGSLQAGDELWIVPGAVVPFVFRPLLDGEHAFVGQAYIHGIMSGEACEILEGREPVEVVLV